MADLSFCIIVAQVQLPAWLQEPGRLQLVLVFVPLALLLLAGLIELWRMIRRKGTPSPMSAVCLGAAALGLAGAWTWVRGQFSPSPTLTWHTSLSLAAAVVAMLSLVFAGLRRQTMYRVGVIACAALALATAHFGGTLTRGPDYLTELADAGRTLKVRVVAKIQGREMPASAGEPSHVRTVAAVANKSPAIDLAKLPLPTAFPADGNIDFTRDVQPILAHACYECHGPAKRRGALRLDNKAMTFDGGNSGPAVVPGKSGESVLIKRVLGLGHEKRMPQGKPALPDYQIKILQAWIDQGAVWPDHASSDEPTREERHWAYVPPVHHEPPKVSPEHEKWVRNGIDNFILARLEKEGLEPSPEADRPTLIRRLSLDLIGLPPTPEEVQAFVDDTSIHAYDNLVNRLLSSPHYGERWGRHWLDIARYADTNGYEKDNPRSIWPYRDWVIDAINRDMTYDQFVIAQIAGDMLPNASIEDRIATGFHRNTMFNEEGGIDVEEFRYKAIVDRVQTTSAAFLGLTMQCAQCHNHKYDTISQKEYFEFAALLNNADEPTLEIPRPDITAKRDEIAAKVREAEAKLESQFPTHEEQIEWTPLKPTRVKAKAKDVVLTKQADHSILASGPRPENDVYTIDTAAVDLSGVTAVRLEVLTDPSLPNNGPGRYDNGNFVVSELKVARVNPRPATRPSDDDDDKDDKAGRVTALKLTNPQADFSQAEYNVASAIDGNVGTGWAIATTGGSFNVNRAASFSIPQQTGSASLRFTIQQQHAHHSLGRFRLSIGRPKPDPNATMAEGERRAKFLAEKMAEWEKSVAAKAVQWTQLDPVTYTRKHGATITKLADKSLLFTGDNLYRDEYQLGFDTDLKDITAIRLEVLPDEHQPKGGPGRNPNGGWLLSGFTVSASPKDAAPATQPAIVELSKASADISPDTIARAIDDKKDTHWTIPVGDARPHAAVFQLKAPLAGHEGGTRLNIALLENYHQQENIGRLRISVTTDPRPTIETAGVPEDVERIVLTPAAQRTPQQLARLKEHFLSITPLLATQRQAIAQLRATMPPYPTTLVMRERAVPRVTRIMHRGEFLQPREAVQPGVPAILPPLPQGKHDRLALAKWLVSPENPLIGRVTMNRIWATYFGRGIVNTVEDFGVMGEKPSHPQLLDWLATELVRQNWSMKAMHRLIVTSSTYRQSSRVSPELLQKDPANVLLARGPRLRVEAETVRDIALAASGLLNEKIGGPSVYPPQPPGVSELSYGAMSWPTSEGPDRYRRGLYTYLKRTSPYPGLIVFDGPTSEVTCTRRIRSNTPLQALTTLNDQVFIEAAQALGQRVVDELAGGTPEQRIDRIFRLCVARAPGPTELEKVKAFYETQLKRFRDKQADPAPVALRDPKVIPSGMDLPEVAAWTMVARTVMNLDETVTKE